jgi:ferrous iron transport protein A
MEEFLHHGCAVKDAGLDTLVPGEKGIVVNLSASTFEIRQRLLEMGLTKGTTIEVIRLAPLGDPIEIKIRGYRLSLRRKEAEAVIVKTEEDSLPGKHRHRWRLGQSH